MAADTHGKLFCMGNPLLDISAEVTEATLSKYDLKLDNAILAEEKHFPIFDELVSDFQVEYIAGGATQNSARVAQWVLQRPGAVSYVGCIGEDKFGQQLLASAQKDGLNVLYERNAETPTGTCAVLVSGKERSLVARLGAAEKASPAFFQSADVQAALEAATHVYIAAFFLTHSADTILEVGKHCAAKNKVFTMNLAAPFLMQVPPFAEKIKAFFPYLDYVFGNEGEAAVFAEMHGWGSISVGETAKKAAMLPKENSNRPRYVVFTQGALPTIIASSTGEYVEVPVPAVSADEIVDTNGAGDAMVGGFLSQLLKGADNARAAEVGHYTAGIIIRRSGCTFPDKPDRTDL